jgi:hypothetical protein
MRLRVHLQSSNFFAPLNDDMLVGRTTKFRIVSVSFSSDPVSVGSDAIGINLVTCLWNVQRDTIQDNPAGKSLSTMNGNRHLTARTCSESNACSRAKGKHAIRLRSLSLASHNSSTILIPEIPRFGGGAAILKAVKLHKAISEKETIL